MSPEDLAQIAHLFASFEQRLADGLEQRLTATEERLTARQDRTVEAVIREISAFRKEFRGRFDTMDRHFEAINAQLDSTDAIRSSLQNLDCSMVTR
jgi:hypothetical protein